MVGEIPNLVRLLFNLRRLKIETEVCQVRRVETWCSSVFEEHEDHSGGACTHREVVVIQC